MWDNARLLHFYPGLDLESIAKMDDTERWLFLRFIENIRARESWDLIGNMKAVRGEKESTREYLTNLAETAFWYDERLAAECSEALNRSS